MKKLLNTLYILSEDSYSALDGENIVILSGEKTVGRYPLHTLQSIVCFSYKGASPALMGKCARMQIDLSFFTPHGRFLARTCGESQGNVLLRRTQYRMADEPHESCELEKAFLIGKIYNARWQLERATRDHPDRVDVKRLKQISEFLAQSIRNIAGCSDMEQLRGYEGEAAQKYFGVLDELILQNRSVFSFSGRSRRPPLDPTNAVLSFVYTLLANACASALEGVGLDSYVGFLHRDRPGRTSLALDLMEELRAVFADRLVVTLINTRKINAKHFETRENGAVFLNDMGRKIVLQAWQERKQEKIRHPFLEESIPWGLVPHVQALLLARFLRGDMDGYPPFLWK